MSDPKEWDRALAPLGGRLPEPSETSSGRLRLSVSLILIGVLLLAGAAYLWYRSTKPGTLSDREIDSCVIAYLADPEFAGEEFSEQLLGQVRFRMDDRLEGYLYFSLDDTDDPTTAQYKAASFLQPGAALEFGQRADRTLSLGDFTLPVPLNRRALFFRTRAENFHIPRNHALRFSYLAADYSPTVTELAEQIRNQTIRKGWLHFSSGPGTMSVNFGALVAVPGETSLNRFVDSLCRHVPGESDGAREKRVKLLLRLVTNEVRYDDSPLARSVEVIRRPCEVLMRRHGDCANKAVLLASLFEQLCARNP